MDRVMIVSADGHVGAQPEDYREYLDPEFRDDLDRVIEERDQFWNDAGVVAITPEVLEVIDERGAIASGGLTGAWDVGRRLEELDREGIVAEVLFPKHQFASVPFFSVTNRPYPALLRAAGARAYHRWLADFLAHSDGRCFGVADPGPCLDIDAAVRELRWLTEHRFVAVSVPGIVPDDALPPLADPYYDPFWATCVELGLCLSVHAGHAMLQGRHLAFIERHLKMGLQGAAFMEAVVNADDSPLKLDLNPRAVLWQLMLGGVLDRFPDITLTLTEVRADWIPAMLAHLDERFARVPLSLALKPSEYWARNCYAGVSSIHRAEVEMREAIGLRQMMFGADYPHPEGTWPNTVDWLRDAFAGVPEHEASRIFSDNAIECYGLDRSHLGEIASRIGPTVEEVLRPREPVDPRKVQHFDSRAAYLRPAESVDFEAVDTLFDRDLARVSS
jgi:predicted TIM-barrel fold metal-dependent hydrolase